MTSNSRSKPYCFNDENQHVTLPGEHVSGYTSPTQMPISPDIQKSTKSLGIDSIFSRSNAIPSRLP